MNILVINKSTVLKDAQIQNWLPAFNVYKVTSKRTGRVFRSLRRTRSPR